MTTGKQNENWRKKFGGIIENNNKIKLNSLKNLAEFYTPGVARVCKKIAEDPEKNSKKLTIRRYSVAIISDG